MRLQSIKQKCGTSFHFSSHLRYPIVSSHCRFSATPFAAHIVFLWKHSSDRESMGYAPCDEHVYLDEQNVTEGTYRLAFLEQIHSSFHNPPQNPPGQSSSVATDISHDTYSAPFLAREHRNSLICLVYDRATDFPTIPPTTSTHDHAVLIRTFTVASLPLSPRRWWSHPAGGRKASRHRTSADDEGLIYLTPQPASPANEKHGG